MTFSAVTNTLLIMENNLVYMAVYCSKQKGGYEEKQSENPNPSYYNPPLILFALFLPIFKDQKPSLILILRAPLSTVYNSATAHSCIAH